MKIFDTDVIVLICAILIGIVLGLGFIRGYLYAQCNGDYQITLFKRDYHCIPVEQLNIQANTENAA